jgi:uncharacterized protein DUF1214
MAQTPEAALRAFAEAITRLADEAAAIEPAIGVRHVARQAALALVEHLEHSDPRAPAFHRYEAPWSQWGAPNPDNVYLRTAIDPSATYVVRGDVRGVREILISLMEGDMHLDEYGVFAERALPELDVAPDGTLELVISPDEHPGNWLPTDPRARILTIRQYQFDWEHDGVASFSIERLDTRGVPAPEPSPADVAAAIDRATHWVERSLHYWARHSTRDGGVPPNTIGPPATPPGGAPHIAYAAGQWSLGPDEALLVTTELPDADYWVWVAHSQHWFDSGDFASRSTSRNHAQVHVDTDGRVRLVLAHIDPGVPNWIDTSDRPAGMLAYRLIGARTKPAPATQVVTLAELRAALPADHPVVDGAARRDELARRRVAVLARFA